MYVTPIDCSSETSEDEFATSLRDTGFAILKNQPWLPPFLMNKIYEGWSAFFNSEKKFIYRFDEQRQEGYFPFRSENSKSSYKKDLKEFFHFYRNSTNVPPELLSDTKLLFEKLDRVGDTLLWTLQKKLPFSVKASFSHPLFNMAEDSPSTLMRILHYPPLSGFNIHDGVRAAEHEDINLITLLPCATQLGLEVKDSKGNWNSLDCDPNCLVVNVGDMLQEATNGYYRSTTHRVVNPEEEGSLRSRYSIPFFIHPKPEVRLSPRYTAQEFLDERLKELGLRSK